MSESDIQLVSLKQAAKLLGLSVSTLRAWAASGKLTTVKVGDKARRVQVSELRRIIAQGLEEAVES